MPLGPAGPRRRGRLAEPVGAAASCRCPCGPRWARAAQRRRGGVPQPARRPAVAPGGVGIVRALRRPGRPRRPAVAPRAAPLVRHPHARPRRRHPGRAGAARTRVDLDDAGVHEGLDRRLRAVYDAAHPRAQRRGGCLGRRGVGSLLDHPDRTAAIWCAGSPVRCRLGLRRRSTRRGRRSQLLAGRAGGVGSMAEPGPPPRHRRGAPPGGRDAARHAARRGGRRRCCTTAGRSSAGSARSGGWGPRCGSAWSAGRERRRATVGWRAMCATSRSGRRCWRRRAATP